MVIHTLEICSGVGMLGEGLRAGLAHLGIETRTVCHIEREAYPATVLAARGQEGSLDDAPVWSDLLTFDARAWHGAVDCIVAGFPCQDISLAGRRAGLDGKRSGLFFDILDIADACGARKLVLENVAGIASATATVMDEAEGELLERAAARVVGELADRGWDAEWITLSASDVGASHGRARWFCFAWRFEVGHAGQHPGSAEHGQQPHLSGGRAGEPGEAGGGGQLDHPASPRRDGARQRPAADIGSGQRLPGAGCADVEHAASRNGSRPEFGIEPQEPEHSGAGEHVAHPERPERRQVSLSGIGSIQGHDAGRPKAHGGPGIADAVLGHADHERAHGARSGAEQDRRAEPQDAGGCVADAQRQRSERRGEPGDMARTSRAAQDQARQRQWCGPAADGGECPMAHPSSAGHQGPELGATRTCNRGGQETYGPASQLCGLFAPGPADPRWPGIIAAEPWLTPALARQTEPGIRWQVDGLAIDVDTCRAERLKCVGNGVVALCAAAAFVVLARRAGIGA